MTATPVGWALICLLIAYYLHILWRQISARSPVATTAFVAAYFILASLLRLNDPSQLLRPVWLPFIYGYAWLALSAAIWMPVTARCSRCGVEFPGESRQIAALLSSQLVLNAGILLSSPLLDWRPMAAYIMLPPVMVVFSYGLYRLFAWRMQKKPGHVLSWRFLLTMLLLSPLACMAVGTWLAPLLLGWT